MENIMENIMKKLSFSILFPKKIRSCEYIYADDLHSRTERREKLVCSASTNKN